MVSLQAFDFRKVPLGLSLNDSARPLKAKKLEEKLDNWTLRMLFKQSPRCILKLIDNVAFIFPCWEEQLNVTPGLSSSSCLS